MTDPDSDDSEEMVSVEIELTKPVAEQCAAAAALTGRDLHGFIETSILTRLQAFDNILHSEAQTGLPGDFDVEAWRKRYQHIRGVETYGPDDG